MPTLPSWAAPGRIVWDDEHNLAFIRRGQRRQYWSVFLITRRGMESWSSFASRTEAVSNIGSHRSLEDARTAALRAIGSCLDAHVKALHPGARYSHLRVESPRPERGYHPGGMFAHACGAPMHLRTVSDHKKVTCPLCLAVMAEDINLKAQRLGAEKFEAAREEIRTIRAFNAFGKVVNDETATEQDI